ncbi:hypothetical protein EDB85DRAFT_2287610 [Lactarius pseudohatsudake]|nr:hypothetical protein EDB85DRAFT_2287610 [Lactarius pseudohatsudake]
MSLLTFVLFYVLVFVQAVPLVKRIVLANWRRVYRDTSSIPSPDNSTGQLLLGFLTLEGENLDILRFPLLPAPRSVVLRAHYPLAQDILLSTGSVQITVPNVSVGSNYIVVLFGDSGNASPQFTITGGSSTTTTPSPSTSTSLLPTHPLSSDGISYPVFPPHLPASSHAHQHVDPWNLHHNVPDLFPIKQHAHAELGHICHECAEQLSVFVLGRNDQHLVLRNDPTRSFRGAVAPVAR